MYMLGGGIVMALLNAVQLVIKAPCPCYTLSSAVTYVLCHGTHRLTSHFLAVKNDNSLKKAVSATVVHNTYQQGQNLQMAVLCKPSIRWRIIWWRKIIATADFEDSDCHVTV